VLSEFAGAADELDEALIVDPHDIGGLKEALADAAAMNPAAQKNRMEHMRKVVVENDIKRWATSFIDAVKPPERKRRR